MRMIEGDPPVTINVYPAGMDVAVEATPGIFDADDVGVHVRGTFGSIMLYVSHLGEYQLKFDPVPGELEVEQPIIAEGVITDA